MSTTAIVNMVIQNNVTFSEAFQFGTAGDTSWSFTGKTFKMDIKASVDDVTPLLAMTSAGGTIVVDDVVNRVLHFNVPDTVILADLPPAIYVYDLVMLDGSSPAIRTPLMKGTLQVCQGATQS